MIGPAVLKGLTVLALGLSSASVQADAPVLASLQAGAIVGLVYDSTMAQPLSGARVFLWNTQMFAEAGTDGSFRIDEVPPGRYDLVFFHPRLTALGVSSGRTPVTVPDNGRVSVALTTPSMPTIMSLLCKAEDPGDERGRAIGHVGDASTGVPLPGARVVVRWTEQTDSGRVSRSATTLADSEGWYSLCTLPPGLEIEGRAHFLGEETRERRFRLAQGQPARIDFSMGEATPGRITGLIRDASTGHGIADAEVVLVDTEYRGVTDRRGRFTIENVEPGPYALRSSHLAYGQRADAVSIQDGRELRVELQMSTEPIELAPLEVMVASEGEIEAVAVGGRLISRAEIDEVRAISTDMGSLLTHKNVPGLLVRRGATTVCVGFMRGQVRMGGRRECVPAQVWINDVPTSDPAVALNLPAEVVDRIILVPPVEAGVMFKVGSSAGVIMVYTRSR